MFGGVETDSFKNSFEKGPAMAIVPLFHLGNDQSFHLTITYPKVGLIIERGDQSQKGD